MPTPLKQKLVPALAVAAFALCYAGVAAALVDKWSTNYIYSYGFAVPFISGYVVWARWPRIQRLARTPDLTWGIPLTLAGLGALVVGRLGALLAIQEASLIITLSGLVLIFLGRAAYRVLSFPILYLLLGIPLWDYPISLFQEPSQTLSARIALAMLHPLGVPALRDGTYLVLPTVTLQVLRECSGVNQLVAIVAMTLPAGFLWLESPVRRIALVTLAIVTAYASNGLRIAITGVLAYNNVKGAHNRDALHLLQGLVVSSLGYILIGACISILAKTERRSRHATASDEAGDRAADPAFRTRVQTLGEIAVVAALVGAGALVALYRPADVRLQKDLGSFPTTIGDWTAQPADASVVRWPFERVDDEISRIYRNSAGNRVELYVGYHRYQLQGKELAGDASHALNAHATPVALQDSSRTLHVKETATDVAGGAAHSLFWYDVNGRVLANGYVAKAYNVWDALTERQTNAGVVVVTWRDAPGRSGPSDRQAALDFAQALLPLLHQYLPADRVFQSAALTTSEIVSR